MTAAPIAVLGLGGIGGMLVARTGALGVGTEGSVEAIRSGGLRLVHGGETSVTWPDVATALDRPVALLVIAVKAYALDAALDRIDPAALDDAVMLPLLNGLEHVATLRGRLARTAPDTTSTAPTVAAGSIGRVEAFSPEPGLVVQRSAGAPRVTAASDELAREALEVRLAPLAAAGVDVAVAEGEGAVLWEKAARLAVLAAASIASGEPVGTLRADPAWRPRVEGALAEACAVAEADGVPLDAKAQWAIVEGLPDGLVPSAARDASVGRPTELDAITGSVVRAARRLGVWTPMLDGLLADASRQS